MGLFSKSKSKSDTTGVDESALVSSGFSNELGDSSSQQQQQQDQPRKKSLYQKYQDLKRGPGTSQMSEEDLIKYTGMNRAEFDKYAATTPGVAGGQAAGSPLAGGNSGLGGSGMAEGLGGWGTEAGKRPKARDERDF